MTYHAKQSQLNVIKIINFGGYSLTFQPRPRTFFLTIHVLKKRPYTENSINCVSPYPQTFPYTTEPVP